MMGEIWHLVGLFFPKTWDFAMIVRKNKNLQAPYWLNSPLFGKVCGSVICRNCYAIITLLKDTLFFSPLKLFFKITRNTAAYDKNAQVKVCGVFYSISWWNIIFIPLRLMRFTSPLTAVQKSGEAHFSSAADVTIYRLSHAWLFLRGVSHPSTFAIVLEVV